MIWDQIAICILWQLNVAPFLLVSLLFFPQECSCSTGTTSNTHAGNEGGQCVRAGKRRVESALSLAEYSYSLTEKLHTAYAFSVSSFWIEFLVWLAFIFIKALNMPLSLLESMPQFHWVLVHSTPWLTSITERLITCLSNRQKKARSNQYKGPLPLFIFIWSVSHVRNCHTTCKILLIHFR